MSHFQLQIAPTQDKFPDFLQKILLLWKLFQNDFFFSEMGALGYLRDKISLNVASFDNGGSIASLKDTKEPSPHPRHISKNDLARSMDVPDAWHTSHAVPQQKRFECEVEQVSDT